VCVAAWDQNWSWDVVEAFFAERGLVKQQIDSFDQFLFTTMQEVVDETFPLEFDVDTETWDDDRVCLSLPVA
jgi:DNA-directed RNA polymerase II subunit RPB2